ncbi:glycosyltransferase [Aquimarina algiphila]|uniref:Glycosyltransferase family 4 protein n=1 Tax=Aquimarina algiphila TaxID=2047982 RepID=A0A554VG12_9FLAO|nr:glycosyltransferase [Aquimarina algiphila]TSE06264.1 glycosyltransferase family 4 protein [Aquimarina algiphila]
MKILIFTSHQPDARFIKYINFLAKNNKVDLVYFQRKTLPNIDSSIEKSILNKINLGIIPNASQPLKRLIKYILATNGLMRIHKTCYDIVLVNNFDILFLFVFSRFFLKKNKDCKIIADISDLREYVFKSNLKDRMICRFEKWLYINYLDKLIVSSKKYLNYHFNDFFKKDVFVLENKLMHPFVETNTSEIYSKDNKTVIGIVGLLLRKNEYFKLFEIYKEDPKIEIHIYGKGLYQNLVEEYAKKYDNIKYFGPYNAFTDIHKIYKSLDIMYLVYDSNQVSLNNRLALPNKLYECMAFKVPILCSSNTYLEEIVKKNCIGFSVDYRIKSEIEEGVRFLIDNQKEILSNFTLLPKNIYYGKDDYKKLESFLLN